MHNNSLRILSESPQFILGHSHESVSVVKKADGRERAAGEHHGDPKIGLITPDEVWFITAGEGLQCYSAQTGLLTFFRRGFPPLVSQSAEPCWYVHDARLDSPRIVRLLIDPWSKVSSEWHLDLDKLSLLKLSDGPFLADTSYRESVDF